MDENRKVLLVTLQIDLTVLGLKHLHYYLLKNGFASRLLFIPEFHPEHPQAMANLKKFVSELNPRFVGVSLMTDEFARARKLSRFLKEHFPSLPIIWGGIHPTVAPETCFPYADYVCVGEGEQTLLDFARALSAGEDPRGINNLCYPEDGQIKRNPLYPLIEDLDSLPFGDHLPMNSYVQDRDRIRIHDRRMAKKYGRYQDGFYDIVTSQGCQLSCTYCSSPFLARLYGSHQVRRRSLENIILELERAVRDHPYIEMVNFQDENFLSYNLEFIKSFKEAYRSRVKRPFMIACTPLWVRREKIALLRAAGLIWVRMGLQSGSDRTLREVYKRKSESGHFLEAAHIFKELGVAVYGDVILDNPLETAQDQLETAKILVQAPRPYYLQLYSLTAFLGTELREMLQAQCPEQLKDSGFNNFYDYEKNRLNDLIRLSAYVPRPVINLLIRLLEQNLESPLAKIIMPLAKAACVFCFEPIALFRVFRKSQGGSILKVLKLIPIYRRVWFERYSHHFQRSS